MPQYGPNELSSLAPSRLEETNCHSSQTDQSPEHGRLTGANKPGTYRITHPGLSAHF